MIRCIYDECQYPDCDFTCEKDRDDIIKMLQERRDELLAERQVWRNHLSKVESAVHSMDFAVRFNTDEVRTCEKTCLHGYDDCIHNPEYLRRHHPEYWIKIGMPTECDPNECFYDDEDK